MSETVDAQQSWRAEDPEGTFERKVVLRKIKGVFENTRTTFVSKNAAQWSKSESFHMPKSLWEAMGSPDKITVVVTPGDQLNKEENGMSENAGQVQDPAEPYRADQAVETDEQPEPTSDAGPETSGEVEVNVNDADSVDVNVEPGQSGQDTSES